MISKKTKIIDILQENPNSQEIMMGAGLYCIGCGGAAFESLEDGAKSLGLSDKDIKNMVESINKNEKK